MTTSSYSALRHPPPLYRLARALRRLSLIVLVLLLLYTGSVVYSAVATARSASNLTNFSAAFQANGTVELSATLTLANNGFYTVQDLSLVVHVANSANVLLGTARVGPTNLPSQAVTAYPVTVFFPVSLAAPGVTLLTQDQSLPVQVWANATFGYLFPVGLAVSDSRSWGAPFANLNLSVGTPIISGGSATVPVTLSFQNHASFSDVGTLDFSVYSSAQVDCGSSSFTLNVPPGGPFSETTDVSLSNGCSPAGGVVTSTFVAPSYSLVLPPERIP